LLGNELEHSSFYRSRPPFRFFQCLSPSEEERASAMVWAKALYTSLTTAEDLALKDKEADRWLKNLMWPTSILCRELLTGCYETDFECLPTDLRKEMEEASKSWAGSVRTEHGHRTIGIAADASPNGSISRVTKWHRLLASPLLTEYDRTLPTISAEEVVKAAHSRVEKTMFEPTANSFSLGSEKYNEILKFAGTLPGHVAYFAIGLATEALIACNGDLRIAANNFLSLLAQPGSMIYHRDVGPGSARWVVRASEHGVYVCRLTPMVKHGQRILDFPTSDGEKIWETLHINDLRGWMVQETQALPPSCCEARDEDGLPLGIVLTVKAGTSAYTVLNYAALQAFRGMTVPFMKKLIRHVDPDIEEMPTVEMDCVKWLIMHCFPAMEDEQLFEIMSKRHAFKLKFETVLTPELVSQAAEFLGDSTTKEMHQEVVAYAKKVAAAKMAAPAPKAKAGAKKTAAKKKFAPKDYESLAAAQKYKPPCPGCMLSIETEWDSRWKITYPTLLPPMSHSASYDPDNMPSMRRALFTVLKWAWAHHEKAGGEPCTFNFD
jgi:hypothetical protein